MSDPNLLAKINDCKAHLLGVLTQVNDLKRLGIKVEFAIGVNQNGMQELAQFHAYEEINLKTN